MTMPFNAKEHLARHKEAEQAKIVESEKQKQAEEQDKEDRRKLLKQIEEMLDKKTADIFDDPDFNRMDSRCYSPVDGINLVYVIAQKGLLKGLDYAQGNKRSLSHVFFQTESGDKVTGVIENKGQLLPLGTFSEKELPQLIENALSQYFEIIFPTGKY